jgi:hypothetical protein
MAQTECQTSVNPNDKRAAPKPKGLESDVAWASSLSFGPREDAGALSKRQRVEWAFETVLVAWLRDFRG